MSFKVKNSQLSVDVLKVMNVLIEKDIDAGIAFKLTRIIKMLSSIVEDKVKMEKKILDKWVERNEFGDPVLAKDENDNDVPDTVLITNIEEFTKDMSLLMNVENNIPYDKINFDELRLQTAKVSDLIRIDFLFE